MNAGTRLRDRGDKRTLPLYSFIQQYIKTKFDLIIRAFNAQNFNENYYPIIDEIYKVLKIYLYGI